MGSSWPEIYFVLFLENPLTPQTLNPLDPYTGALLGGVNEECDFYL